MMNSKTVGLAFWIVTALFCVEMISTAYWESFTPDASHAFARLGFPAASPGKPAPFADLFEAGSVRRFSPGC